MCLRLLLSSCHKFSPSFLFAPPQKNLKKNISKYAKGNGERAVRNYANASVRSRQLWLDAGSKEDEEWMWAEAFIRFFNHLAIHLQGQLWS